MSIMMGMPKPSRRGSTMIVVPRLLIKNSAIPSYRRAVPPLAANADLVNGRVSEALAWYLFPIVPASVSVRPRTFDLAFTVQMLDLTTVLGQGPLKVHQPRTAFHLRPTGAWRSSGQAR
jgi:hypothetical protein